MQDQEEGIVSATSNGGIENTILVRGSSLHRELPVCAGSEAGEGER